MAPKHVAGRVAHIDADIMAYELCYKNVHIVDDRTRRNKMHADAYEYIEQLKYYSGSEFAVLHTTPSKSSKGNRFNQALIKPYQGNRKGKVKPLDLEYIREYLAHPPKAWVHGLIEPKAPWKGIAHMDQEADDGLAQALHQAHLDGQEDLAVSISLDKDLRMLKGWHLDWRTYEMKKVTDLGEVHAEGDKIKGSGLKWFFFQMLCGDTADNISGIPKLAVRFCEEYLDKTPKKPKLCGPKTALLVLKDLETVQECFECVCKAFKYYDDEVGFKKYDTKEVDDEGYEQLIETGRKITAKEAFLSEAYLLWMRQSKDEEDFLLWIGNRDFTNMLEEIL